MNLLTKQFTKPLQQKRLQTLFKKNFGRGGPYNPNRYKDYFVPRTLPKNEEIYEYAHSVHSVRPSPVRNIRHVNPVRESGPLPAYDGTYTMEDIKDIYFNTSIGRDFCYCQMDPEEIMRRVPGITRKECEHIIKLGLTPQEQVDFAYLAYNLGLDVFYFANQVFIARQVVTNSKGEKVEVLWNTQTYEDLAMMNVGFAPVVEFVDYHWELFLWGDPPIKPTSDFDLNVPCTWFEYEQEWWGESNLLEDQMNPPQDMYEFPVPRNPHARKELWRSQEKLERDIHMNKEEWYPEDTKYNIYNQKDYKVTQNSQSDNINI